MSLAGLSASVTRILSLTGFSKELKTKDIQSAFSEWENVNGGFKIKWRDDTSLLIVFQDASVAKRAYLHTLAYPPSILSNANGGFASIRPYDGPDAQTVIQNVNSRGQHNPNPSRHTNRSASISVFPNGGAGIGRGAPLRQGSTGHNNGNGNGNAVQNVTIPEFHPGGREPSPTLPNLPSHPTLNSLINLSLSDGVAPPPPVDPAIVAMSDGPGGGPRIGDPGKRMLGAALGVRHPGLGPRVLNGNAQAQSGGGGAEQAMREVQRAMSGMAVAE